MRAEHRSQLEPASCAHTPAQRPDSPPFVRPSGRSDNPNFVLQRRPTYKVSFLGGGVPLDLRFRAPLRRNPPSGALKSIPGPREGSSILNLDLVVVTAAVISS